MILERVLAAFSKDETNESSAARPVPYSVLGWFVVACSIFTISALLVVQNVRYLIHDNDWIAHSYSVLATLNEVEAGVAMVESSQRGYLMSGRAAHLSPYTASRLQLGQNLETLEELTRHSESQSLARQKLEAIVQSYLEQSERTIERYNNQGIEEVRDPLADDRAGAQMRDFRTTLAQMQRTENEMLSERRQSLEMKTLRSMIVGVTGILTCFLILSLVFWRIRTESRRRVRSEHYLQQANARLEHSLEELKLLNEQAKVLNVLGEFLLTCRSKEEALHVLGNNIRKLLPGFSGAIGVLNMQHDTVELIEPWGLDNQFKLEFASDSCWALRRGRIHHTAHNQVDPTCRHFLSQPNETLCIPMIAQGETLGVLCLLAKPGNAIDEKTLQTATTLAEQTSLALANLQLQETLRMQSVRDQLTGLFNRRYLEESLTREISRSKRHGTPISIAMIDIDHFKQFNDTHGHEAGDVLLEEFGRLLRGFVRSEDIACRYGGEEFTIILPGAPLDTAGRRMVELCDLVKKMHVLYQGRSLGHVTISAGVASYPHHGESGNSVIAMADSCLYKAKQAGRDQVFSAVIPENNPNEPLRYEEGGPTQEHGFNQRHLM